MRIERANPSDLQGVGALLVSAGLPLDGVASAFETGVIVREGDSEARNVCSRADPAVGIRLAGCRVTS